MNTPMILAVPLSVAVAGFTLLLDHMLKETTKGEGFFWSLYRTALLTAMVCWLFFITAAAVKINMMEAL